MSGRVKHAKMVPLDRNPRVKLYAIKAKEAVAGEERVARNVA